MKNYYASQTRSLFTLLLVTLVLGLFSCARKIHFENSEIVPTAQGSVKLKKDRNDNYQLEIETLHLANPEKLTPAKKIYIVWAETTSNGTQNLGRLNSKNSFMSKALKSELHATTAYEPTRVFVTAEDEATVSYPSGQVVLTTKTFD